MDEKRQRDSHSFTWGMLVGGALVLMLATSKGRQILKEITEGGIEGLEDYIDLDKVKEITKEFTDVENDDEVSRNSNDSEKEESQQSQKLKKPRFFRRSRK